MRAVQPFIPKSKTSAAKIYINNVLDVCSVDTKVRCISKYSIETIAVRIKFLITRRIRKRDIEISPSPPQIEPIVATLISSRWSVCDYYRLIWTSVTRFPCTTETHGGNSILVLLFARSTRNWSCAVNAHSLVHRLNWTKASHFSSSERKMISIHCQCHLPLFALYLFIIARSVCMTVELVKRLNTSSLFVFNKHKQVGHSVASAHTRVVYSSVTQWPLCAS